MKLSDAAVHQGELWGKGVRDWVALIEPSSVPIWTAALTAAKVGPGIKLLDAGCGAGGASVLAASMGADPSGIDSSAGMITVARERLPLADFRVGELEDLPFPNAAFGAVIAVNSLQFTAQPRLALHELGRVAKAGKPVVVIIWDVPENSDLGVVFDAVRRLFDQPPTGKGPFALSEPGVLNELFASVDGLKLERVAPIECTFEYSDIEQAVRAHGATGPAKRAGELLGAERVDAAVREAYRPFVQPDGRVVTRNRFLCATGLRS